MFPPGCLPYGPLGPPGPHSGGLACVISSVTVVFPRLTKRGWLALLCFAALAAAAWAALTIYRASRAITDSAVAMGREARISFTTARLDRASAAGFESIAAPESFRDAVVYGGRLYVCGPGGLIEFDGEEPGARYRTGLELPGPPVALAVGARSGASGQELLIATAGAGLLAFDGSIFRQIRPGGAAERDLTSVLPLATGSILLGTEKRGVLEWDGKEIRPFHPALEGLHVTALAGDDSSLWVGTVNRGVLHWHAGQIETFGEAQGLPDSHILSLAVQGDAAYAGTALGVTEFKRAQFSRVLARGLIANALLVRSGALAIGTLTDGVLEVPLGSGRARPQLQPIPSIQRLITIDRTLYALSDRGLYRIDDVRLGWRRVLSAEGAVLSDRNVSALEFDAAGRLWVGYFDHGLDILDSSLGQARHVENDHVFCVNRIADDRERGLTAVATANGLVLFDRAGRERQVLRRSEGLIANQVSDVLPRPGGMVIATSAGITLFDSSGARSLYAFHGLVNNHVYALAGTGDHLLAGTLGGLSILDGGIVRASYTTANSGLKHNWITAIVPVDSEWFVGTYGAGVLRFDQTGHWQTFPDLDRRFEVNFNAMLATPRAIYAGSLAGGLYVYGRANGRWRNITSGLPSRNVTALAAHGDFIYVGTDNGLIRFREHSQ